MPLWIHLHCPLIDVLLSRVSLIKIEDESTRTAESLFILQMNCEEQSSLSAAPRKCLGNVRMNLNCFAGLTAFHLHWALSNAMWCALKEARQQQLLLTKGQQGERGREGKQWRRSSWLALEQSQQQQQQRMRMRSPRPRTLWQTNQIWNGQRKRHSQRGRERERRKGSGRKRSETLGSTLSGPLADRLARWLTQRHEQGTDKGSKDEGRIGHWTLDELPLGLTFSLLFLFVHDVSCCCCCSRCCYGCSCSQGWCCCYCWLNFLAISGCSVKLRKT